MYFQHLRMNVICYKATSTEPEEIYSKIAAEQADMHARMITENGHLLIQLARCCIESPDTIEQAFPNISPEISPILRNLDKQVITLIADTPIVMQDKKPTY